METSSSNNASARPAARILLRAFISPSEDPEKVLGAMRQVIGDCEYGVEERPGSLVLTSDSAACLQKLHDQLRDRHVRDAARRLLLRSLGEDGAGTPALLLNRQAAAVGVLAVCSNEAESPLGPLFLEMEAPDRQRLIDWLTAH